MRQMRKQSIKQRDYRNLRLNSPSNTSKRRACSACTSFAHSLRLSRLAPRTWDNILSDRCRRAAWSREFRRFFSNSPRRSWRDATGITNFQVNKLFLKSGVNTDVHAVSPSSLSCFMSAGICSKVFSIINCSCSEFNLFVRPCTCPCTHRLLAA